MNNQKKSIIYYGILNKVSIYFEAFIIQEEYEFINIDSKSPIDGLLTDFENISFIMIDYENWSIDLDFMLTKLKSINTEIKICLLFENKEDLLENHLKHNETYDRLIINHVDLKSDIAIILKDYKLTEIESNKFLTIKGLNIESLVTIPLYAHGINDENLLIKKPLFSDEIINQEPILSFREMKLIQKIYPNNTPLIQNEYFFHIKGNFKETISRIKTFGYFKLPYLETTIICPKELYSKYSNILDCNHIGLSFSETLQIKETTNFYIIDSLNFTAEEINTFLTGINNKCIILIINATTKIGKTIEAFKDLNISTYNEELEIEDLKKITALIVEGYNYEYYFFPRNDTLKIGDTSINIKIVEMSETHFIIESPYSVEIGTMIEVNVGIQIIAYNTMIEKVLNGYNLHFSILSLNEDDINFLRQKIHSMHFCLEKGIKLDSIKNFIDLKLKLKDARAIE